MADNATSQFNRRAMLLGTTAAAVTAASTLSTRTVGAQAPGPIQGRVASDRKPNILVIWGDDIGWQNVSAYGMGTMGYTTPNIDRIGMEGIRFTDHYGQPSCTAGRAAFITGQYPIRSGMTTVGQPGDKLGLQQASPCLAEVMKAQEKMTTYEGGVRLLSMLRWPNVIKPGQMLNGIQCHQDMFTSLAAAAGVADVASAIMTQKKQYIDGVNNLPYWKGETKESARSHVYHYYENKLAAMRMRQWKWHFSTKEDYYANLVPRTAPLLFNLRMDPFESYDNKDSYGHLLQWVSWLMQPMGELMKDHLRTLAEYPPVQGSKSFDMSNIVEQFLNKGRD